jgi:hypothetical protein
MRSVRVLPAGLLVLSLIAVALGQTSTSCSTSSGNMTTTFRQQILDLHNNLRKALVNGQAPNKSGFLPKGKNIYRLTYACDLEQALYNSLSCSQVVPDTTMEYQSAPLTTAQVQAKLIAKLNSNWNQSVVYGVSSDIAPNANTKDWAKMAADRLSKVGCAMLQCAKQSNGWYPIVYGCVYDYSLPSTRPAYVAGNPCTTDDDCTRLPNSGCLTTKLCTELFSYPAPGVNTMCPGGSTRLDDRARQRFVDMHNNLRKNLIHGLEPMGNMNTFAPTGSNMYEMTWNCGIESKAQQYANNNVFQHSSDAYRNYDGIPHGENLMGPTGTKPAFYLLEQAATAFWDELLAYGWEGVNDRTVTDNDFAATIGHWSQMAWHDTYQLGAGISTSNIVVAQYGPTGNWGGEQVYPEGQPCQSNSDCTNNSGDTCNTATGMCKHS